MINKKGQIATWTGLIIFNIILLVVIGFILYCIIFYELEKTKFLKEECPKRNLTVNYMGKIVLSCIEITEEDIVQIYFYYRDGEGNQYLKRGN